MKWEDLKVYKPLLKEELTTAKKEIIKKISEVLEPFGFKLYGRKLIRLSNDLFHVIHLDTRGSWAGASTDLKIEIAVVSVYDTEVFLKNHELKGRKLIQDLIPGIKNYYQITQEYNLFSEYISRNIIESIIPYLDNFKNSKNVLQQDSFFKIEIPIKHYENNVNLVMFAELESRINKNVSSILNYKISFLKQLSQSENLNELITLKECVDNADWNNVSAFLKKNKKEVFKKLKIKENEIL